jgi:hypothetical protein
MINTYLSQSALVAMDRMRHEAELNRLMIAPEDGGPETKPSQRDSLWHRIRGLLPRLARYPAEQSQPMHP